MTSNRIWTRNSNAKGCNAAIHCCSSMLQCNVALLYCNAVLQCNAAMSPSAKSNLVRTDSASESPITFCRIRFRIRMSMQCNVMQLYTVQCDETPCNGLQSHAMAQCHTMLQCIVSMQCCNAMLQCNAGLQCCNAMLQCIPQCHAT